MSTTATLKPGNQLWGIYYTDREYAREMGDPLRKVVEAPTTLAAEEIAARLGFNDPWAHPMTSSNSTRLDPPLASLCHSIRIWVCPNPFTLYMKVRQNRRAHQ